MIVTEAMIDAGAEHLRNTTQASKQLIKWELTDKRTKQKWLALSEGALNAAVAADKLY